MKTRKLMTGMVVVFLMSGYAWGALPTFWTSATGFQARGPVTYSQLSVTYTPTVKTGVPQDNGTFGYCSDCTALPSGVCTSGGSGSFFQRVNGEWKCGVFNSGVIGTVPDPLSINEILGTGVNANITRMNTDGGMSITAYGGSCSDATISCTANGTTTLSCSGGVGDFRAGEGVWIPNGSTTASSLLAAPDPPTVAVGMSTRIQNCTDVTITGDAGGGKATYVSAAQCDFTPYQAGDRVKITGAATAGNNGFFVVDAASGGTLTLTTTKTDEVAGAAVNFQTAVPIGGGNIAVGNCVKTVGVTLDPMQRPLLRTGAVGYGQFTESDAAGACTLTFHATDGGKPVTVYYQTATPPAGAAEYCFKTSVADGGRNGHSPASAAACVTTAVIYMPNLDHGMPFLIHEPATTAGAYGYDEYELDQGGGSSWCTDTTIGQAEPQSCCEVGFGSPCPASYYLAGRVWPPTQSINTQVTLPAATLTVGSTLGFPETGTLNILGQAVTYTGKTAATFTGCSGGTGLVPAGTAVTGSAPYTNVSAGTGGVQMGESPWSAEDVPAAPPVTAVNEDFSLTAPPTVVSASGTTLVLTQAVAAGTWTVTHSDQNAWKAAFAAVPNYGATIYLPNDCVSRFCQLPLSSLGSTSDKVIIKGQAGQALTSELQSYCDGGGPWTINSVNPEIGAISNNGILDIKDVEITTTNSNLGVAVNSSQLVFTTLGLENVGIDAIRGANAQDGVFADANHTTALSLRLADGYANNLIVRDAQRPIALNAAVNTWQLLGRGSINKNSLSRFWHGDVEFEGASSYITIGPSAIFEVPWTALRPADGAPGNFINNLVWTNNYMQDIADINLTRARIHGAIIDFQGIGKFDGTFGGGNPGLTGMYFSNGSGTNVLLNSPKIAAGRGGVIAETGTNVTINGLALTNLGSNSVGVEMRGDGTVQGQISMAVQGGATGVTAFKAGYQPDESTCNTTSSTHWTYEHHPITGLTDISVCPTVEDAVIRNDTGVSIVQGVKPTIGNGATGSCGGSPSVAAGSTNRSGLFTAGTAGAPGTPDVCRITFATLVQTGMSSTPRCIVIDQTGSVTPIPIRDVTVTAAPTAKMDVTFDSASASHTYQYWCDNWY